MYRALSHVLTGVNQVNKRPPYTPQAVGFDARNAALIASLGHNVVRLGVCFAALLPAPAAPFATAYVSQVLKTVAVLAEHGIYSIIDLHQDAWSPKHGGFLSLWSP